MKFPYAVRRYNKGKYAYLAWTPFDSCSQGRGNSKEEAIADLRKQLQEVILRVEGEIGEMEI